MKVRTFLKPSDSMTRRKASILISFLPPTLMPRRNATYSIISTMFDGDALGRRVRQIRFVLGIGLPISHLDINIARRDHTLLERKPYCAEIGGLAESAKSVEPFAA